MKKATISMIIMLSFSVVGYSQEASDTDKQSILINSEQLTFKSVDEKNDEIKRIEELIRHRESHGRTKDQLVNHYAELERVRNAKVITVNSAK